MKYDGFDWCMEVTKVNNTPVVEFTLNKASESVEDLRLEQIPTFRFTSVFAGKWKYVVNYSPTVCAAIRDKVTVALQHGATVGFETVKDREAVIKACDELPQSTASFEERYNRACITAPSTPLMHDMMRRLQATPLQQDKTSGLGRWSIPAINVRDFMRMNEELPSYNRIQVQDSLLDMTTEVLPPPYDGTAESLRGMPVTVLRTVNTNFQSYKMTRKSNDTIASKLNKMGINDLYDLLMYRPRRYLDRSNPQDVRDLIEGEHAVIVGKLVEWKHPSPKLNIMVVEDARGVRISASFFNQHWIPERYKVGVMVILTGKYKPWYPNGSNRIIPQIESPVVDELDAAGALPIMPEYRPPSKVGLSSGTIMHCEQELIQRLGPSFKGPVWTDKALRDNGITTVAYGNALQAMHLPKTTESLTESQSALAFCELVELLVWIESQRTGQTATVGVANNHMDGALIDAYKDSFKWPLTGAQSRAIDTIRKRMKSKSGLRALLVGDVGAGKTTVMHMAALSSVEAGHQAVICAPTEILAQQLYDDFIGVYEKFPEDLKHRVTPVLHCGYKGKGSTARRRNDDNGIADGSINMIFGTHSVLNVDYADLGFVGVDEQHKFGAKQRSRLLEVREDGREPDMLMQTATPIPRSMAQVYYGDVDYLRLDEMPAGRQPIVTEWVKKKGREVLRDPDSVIWKDAKREIAKGHGVFVVCPMVSDNKKVDAAGVKSTAQQLEDTVFSDARVAVVYGGQPAKEQDAAILGFKNGEIDVLVASSVVEVGVSCVKATRMIVLDANRFGLASLHQIRGRIGRSTLASKCWLVAMTFNDNAQRRMQAMVDTMDGWTLSKTDLKNRGTGSIFSDKQSGEGDLVFADLVGHAHWIDPARQTALKLLKGPDSQERINEARRYFGVDDDTVSLA